jgi:hypothetical protein
MVIQKYTTAIFLLFLLLCDIAQLLYFEKRPSTKCILTLNIFNLGLAMMRLVATMTPSNCNNEGFFYSGIAIITLHYALLINPSFMDNVLLMTLIFVIYQIASYITLSKFTLEPLSMFPVVMVHLYKNYKEIR